MSLSIGTPIYNNLYILIVSPCPKWNFFIFRQMENSWVSVSQYLGNLGSHQEFNKGTTCNFHLSSDDRIAEQSLGMQCTMNNICISLEVFSPSFSMEC